MSNVGFCLDALALVAAAAGLGAAFLADGFVAAFAAGLAIDFAEAALAEAAFLADAFGAALAEAALAGAAFLPEAAFLADAFGVALVGVFLAGAALAEAGFFAEAFGAALAGAVLAGAAFLAEAFEQPAFLVFLGRCFRSGLGRCLLRRSCLRLRSTRLSRCFLRRRLSGGFLLSGSFRFCHFSLYHPVWLSLHYILGSITRQPESSEPASSHGGFLRMLSGISR